jgi:hypothetical protein
VVLSRAGRCLAVALILAPAAHLSAQSSQPPPAQAQPQPPPVAQPQAPPVQPQPEPTPPQTRRQGRKKGSPRTSRRPSPPAPVSLEENRTSRVAGPTRQELTLAANVLGGYDDNLTAGFGTGPGVLPAPIVSGSTGYVDAALGYFRGNTLRSIRVQSTGNVQAYPGYLDHPAAGGAATVGAGTTLGGDLTLRASERVAYEPLFNVFSTGASNTPLPPGIGETVPATGLYERRSLSSYTSVSVDRRWSGRDSTSLSYSYRVEQFTNVDYGDNSSHNALAEYRRNLTRGVKARASYRYVDTDYIASDGVGLPNREHTVEGGPEIEKTLSRRRRLTLSLGAGASYIESVTSASREPYHAWVPIGSARATLGLTPVWSVEGGYQRGFSLLRGVTDDVYTTDTAYLASGWLVTTRTDLRVGATYSDWRTPLASGVNDTFIVYGGSVQMRVWLAARVAASANYFYYHHRYSNPGDLPAGFPAEYDRNAVRVGLTVWFPLVGTSFRPSPTVR